ncbi:MAG: signal recognition particle-docking protein FtsY [Candidatus Symbiobacter sp.]|nr:signal recognition particle-docking protein FtsY [Candidatus Symbiobacter sp.]
MNFAEKLRQNLAKSARNLLGGLKSSFGGGKIDASTWQELEETLIRADFGPKFAASMILALKSDRELAHLDGIAEKIAAKIEMILSPLAQPLSLAPHNGKKIILVTGVNGSGKTTSIGKLAFSLQQNYRQNNGGKNPKIMLVAADTFRAAAVSQLQIWAERTGVTCVTAAAASDPAALVFQALDRAKAENYDLVLIDTAGRLNNNQGLMDELGKILRVIKKHDETAPHHSILVLDATIGQNAINQVTQFQAQAALNGLIITKLDGTAKAGILVDLAERFALPIYAIGVGEGIDDLHPFDAREFARNLLDLPPVA